MNYYVFLLFSFSLSVSSYGMESMQKEKEDQSNNFFNINGVKKIVNSYSDFLFKCANAPHLSTVHPIIGCTRKKGELFSGTRALMPSILGNSPCDGSVQNFINKLPGSFNGFPQGTKNIHEKLQLLKKIRMEWRFDIVMEMFQRLLPPSNNSSLISSGGFLSIFMALQEEQFFSLQQQQREAFFKLFTIVPVASLLDSKKRSYYANGPTGCQFFTTEKRGEVYFSNVIHCGCCYQQQKDGCFIVGEFVLPGSEKNYFEDDDHDYYFFWTKQNQGTLQNTVKGKVNPITIDSVVIQIPLCGNSSENEKFLVLYDEAIHRKDCTALKWIRENMYNQSPLTKKLPSSINDLSLHFLLMQLFNAPIAHKLSQLFDQKNEVVEVIKKKTDSAHFYPLKESFFHDYPEDISFKQKYDLKFNFLPISQNENFCLLLVGNSHITDSSNNVVYFGKEGYCNFCFSKVVLSFELMVIEKGTLKKRKKFSIDKIIYRDDKGDIDDEKRDIDCNSCVCNWQRPIERGVGFLQDVITILNYGDNNNGKGTSVNSLIGIFSQKK